MDTVTTGSQIILYEGNGTPIIRQKIDRNAPCPCGSGKKSKRCCGTETKYFNSGEPKINKWQTKNERQLREMIAAKKKEAEIKLQNEINQDIKNIENRVLEGRFNKT